MHSVRRGEKTCDANYVALARQLVTLDADAARDGSTRPRGKQLSRSELRAVL
jgi:hypothetical protein